ncbi:MAG: hypothetical protein V1645_01985 [archaeon]
METNKIIFGTTWMNNCLKLFIVYGQGRVRFVHTLHRSNVLPPKAEWPNNVRSRYPETLGEGEFMAVDYALCPNKRRGYTEREFRHMLITWYNQTKMGVKPEERTFQVLPANDCRSLVEGRLSKIASFFSVEKAPRKEGVI